MNDFNELFNDDLFSIEKVKDKTTKLKDGERRMVSILFADVKGFTALSETLDHEEIQSLMDHIMKIFTHSVESHGGYVDKYTGDQIMALFGAKSASEVDTQRAISTGIDMLQKLNKFNEIVSKSKNYSQVKIDLSIRVGINTGMVTTGKIGKEREGDYTVYGDSVNLASRMESNAPVNSIMIPEYTMNLVRNSFTFTDNGSINVKGKKEPISVFLVKSKKDDNISHKTPFVGREVEIDTLTKLFDKESKYLKTGIIDRLSFIGLHAEAGVGKSRILHEFLDSKVNFNTDMYSMGTCSNISSQPYHLFISLIKDSFNISIIDDIDVISKKLSDGLNRLIKDNKSKEEQIIKAKPILGFLLGISSDDARIKNKEDIVNHIHISIRVLLESLCSKANKNNKCYVLIFEDLHWIDKMSLETIYYIMQTFNIQDKRDKKKLSVPIFIATFRNEYIPNDEIKNYCKYFDLSIEPLKKDYSLILIDELTKKTNIDKKTKNELYKKSSGNPFFIEEWCSLIQEKKSSESIDDSRDIKHAYKIPNTLNSLILSRIDSLEKDLKLLLQKATIIGEDFFLKILSLLESKLGLKEDINKPVDNLETQNFIQHYLKEIDRYRFKHILTRDVAYSTILKSNKKILHRAVAEVIEENFKHIIEKFYFDLAVHYDTCKNTEKALFYLEKSTISYNKILDRESELKCYSRIIEIIQENNLEYDIKYFDAQCKIADIHNYSGDTKSSISILKELLNDKNANEESTALINFYLGGTYENIRENKLAVAAYQESYNFFSKNNKHRANDINKSIGRILTNTGNYNKALEILLKALDFYKSEKDYFNIALTFQHIGAVHFNKGEYDKSYKYYKDEYDIAKKIDAKILFQPSGGNLALINMIKGNYAKSLNIFNEILIVLEDINDKFNIGLTYGNIGIAYKNLREFDDAIENYLKQLDIATKSNYQSQICSGNNNIGLCYYKKGDFKTAEKHFNKAIALSKKINDKNEELLSTSNLGLLLTDMGKYENAEEIFNNNLLFFEQIKNVRLQGLVKMDLSKIYLENNQYDKSLKLIKNSINNLEKTEDFPYLTKALTQQAKAYRKLKNLIESEKSLDRALEISKNINDIDLINKLNIEKYINALQSDDKVLSESELLSFSNKNIGDEHKAYIHYNLWKYCKNNSSKEASFKLYKKLYKKSPKHIFKMRIDFLK